MWHRPLKSRSDRVRPEPPLSLRPSHPGLGCVLRGGGIGKCQHLRRFGLWRVTGISAMFLLLTTLSARSERGGGGGLGGSQLWSDNREGESESLGLRGF